MSNVAADVAPSEDGHQSSASDQNKVTVSFKAVGNAPVLAKSKLKIDRLQTVASLATFLRKRLHIRDNEDIFIFVASSFTPALDTDIGTVFDCFSAEGRNLLRDFFYSAISISLLQLNAYPNNAFKSASVFGTPVKVLRASSLRKYVINILDSLQLSVEGQQELVLRYRSSENGDYSDIIFRFQCTVLAFDEAINADNWKEELGSALGQMWMRPPPMPANGYVRWSLLVRNWFQSDTQPAFRDLIDSETPSYRSRTCLPICSINRYGLNIQILHVFPKPTQ
ncbi:hypothetical protein Aperf_G00000099266 [Anoplocephala perfoliata]